ncbi:glycosyltransferase family 4 protein [Rhodohalobacter barkolensis]|uniref:Glycosyltransferase WbuB n=1 Tax=Rhodohalobacter barkolensis TaxID=2053187 RepID=A0A2N0VKC5_9BACT|nr:glycosyltransferase family 4 protein [Rhodohalobacter barkolensis]PKD44645.1 glycosyltransferase WbuB [Rhodohalobacter barkolensis]
MKILFITDNFPPEVNAPATRTYEHAIEWVNEGAEVTVLTCNPNFPQGKIYDGYKNRIKQVEHIDGIKVVRLWSYISANQGFVKRTLDYMSFAWMSSVFGLFEKADVIIATSPQFFTTWAGWFLSKLKRKPWVFELRDLWPESIATVGAMSKESRAYRTLEKIELGLYKSADLVIPNTPAFKTNLVNRGIPKEKMHVIPNGANLELFDPDRKNPELKEKLGIKEEFVIGYIGTHGLAHSLDFVIESIAKADFGNIHFLFIGDGAEKEKVKSMAEDKGLENVTFLDPIPKDQIPDYLALTNASLVPLKKSDTFKTVIPSKIFEACAMGKPIILGVEGQAKEIIDEFDAGVCFEPENSTEFADAVNRLVGDKELYQTLSENALNLARAYDRKKLAKEMLEVIREKVVGK